MADEHEIDDTEWVSAVLRDAATPDPAAGTVSDSPSISISAMPDSVWARLQTTIDAEQQARSDASAPTASAVDHRSDALRAEDLTPPAAPVTRSRKRVGLYALAASAALVVGGAVVVSTLDQSQVPAAVAEAPAGTAGGSDPAAVRVLASGTDYSATGLTTQLGSMLKQSLGLKRVSDLATMPPDATPVEGTTGVTSSVAQQHACLESLTGTAEADALVLDRATVLGQDAVIVVMQASEATNPTVAPTAEITTEIGPVHVWAVTPQCTPLTLTPATTTSSLDW